MPGVRSEVFRFGKGRSFRAEVDLALPRILITENAQKEVTYVRGTKDSVDS